MAKWELRNLDKKSVEIITYWEKDGKEITLTERFRWGSVFIYTDGDDAPVTDLKNDHGLDVTEFEQTEVNDMDDLYSQDWDFSGDPDADAESLEEGWEEEGFEYLENEGWSHADTEIVFFGPLELQKLEE